ncbi:unnamed protein product [Protopolystoma xenopodis]|uniref:Uncharacterized protein n=1 Tax=Protopolystoma xenopodis TaxID=117903 RepID=A0A3S5CHA3_9PLAT|nr:unnamed protein product [Protopolystoma xenopodis]
MKESTQLNHFCISSEPHSGIDAARSCLLVLLRKICFNLFSLDFYDAAADILSFIISCVLKQSASDQDYQSFSPRIVNAMWSSLFGTLDHLIKSQSRLWYLTKKPKSQREESNVFNILSLYKQLVISTGSYVDVLFSKSTAIRSDTATAICSFSKDWLPKLSNMLASTSGDNLTFWIPILSTTVFFYALYNFSPDLGDLLSDLAECHKRVCSDDVCPSKNSPPWPAVLTDVLITLSTDPCSLFRTIIHSSFSCLISQYEAHVLSADQNTSPVLSLIIDALKAPSSNEPTQSDIDLKDAEMNERDPEEALDSDFGVSGDEPYKFPLICCADEYFYY